ncbi:MAG: hypothetical protein ABL921_07955 [Pirellula sp.]
MRINSSNRLLACAPFLVAAVVTLSSLSVGCSPAESVYHDGNFTEEQKVAAKKEYESIDDQESQGSIHKKKATKR